MMFPEPENFVRFIGVIQIRKIWIDSRLPIRLLAFFDERHWKSLGESLRKRKTEICRPNNFMKLLLFIFFLRRGS